MRPVSLQRAFHNTVSLASRRENFPGTSGDVDIWPSAIRLDFILLPERKSQYIEPLSLPRPPSCTLSSLCPEAAFRSKADSFLPSPSGCDANKHRERGSLAELTPSQASSQSPLSGQSKSLAIVFEADGKWHSNQP